jgi:hypothetical protein
MKLQGGYRVVAYRSICRLCLSPNALIFSVPDDTWETVVPLKYQNADLCIECFENLVCDKQIELFYSVSRRSDTPIKPRTSLNPRPNLARRSTKESSFAPPWLKKSSGPSLLLRGRPHR